MKMFVSPPKHISTQYPFVTNVARCKNIRLIIDNRSLAIHTNIVSISESRKYLRRCQHWMTLEYPSISSPRSGHPSSILLKPLCKLEVGKEITL